MYCIDMTLGIGQCPFRLEETYFLLFSGAVSFVLRKLKFNIYDKNIKCARAHNRQSQNNQNNLGQNFNL